MSSPGSLIADSTTSPASTDNCPTPAAICEKFRSGPFGHIFDAMRLTENERDMMEDLLSPATTMPTLKRKQDEIEVEVAPDDYFETDHSFLQSMFATPEDKRPHSFVMDSLSKDTDYDAHLSKVSPTAEGLDEEAITTTHKGIVVYDYDALSVDDFFDLDEAST